MRDNKSIKVINQSGAGFGYFVTVIGAAVYFVQHASGFWGVVLALLEALVWPAFAVHRVLELLQI